MQPGFALRCFRGGDRRGDDRHNSGNHNRDLHGDSDWNGGNHYANRCGECDGEPSHTGDLQRGGYVSRGNFPWSQRNFDHHGCLDYGLFSDRHDNVHADFVSFGGIGFAHMLGRKRNSYAEFWYDEWDDHRVGDDDGSYK